MRDEDTVCSDNPSFAMRLKSLDNDEFKCSSYSRSSSSSDSTSP